VLRDSKGKEQTCELSQDKWAKAQEGSSYRGKASVITGGLDCTSLGL
jgi:hypothetical protein